MNLHHSLLLTFVLISTALFTNAHTVNTDTRSARQALIDKIITLLNSDINNQSTCIQELENTHGVRITRELLLETLTTLLMEENRDINNTEKLSEKASRPFPPNATKLNNLYVQNQLMVNGVSTTKNHMYVLGDFYAGKKGQMCFSSAKNALGLGTHKPTEMLDVRGNANIEKDLTVGNLKIANLSNGFVVSQGGVISIANQIGHNELADNSVGTFQLIDRCVTPDKLSADLAHGISSPTETGLKMVRGTVGSDGTIISGTGFSVDVPTTGSYIITFEYSFKSTNDYVLLVTPSTSQNRRVNSQNTSSTEAIIQTASNDGGTPAAQQFSFIAIGV